MNIQDFGFELSITVHLHSDDHGHDAAVAYTLPRHQPVTREDIDKVIRECIDKANEAGGVEDYKVVTLEDLAGISTPESLRWNFPS